MTASRYESAGATAGVAVDRPRHYLYPARLIASREPVAITTVLGSCVAVCLWDPRRRVGGVNHFLLPHWVESGQDLLRFGSAAVPRLVSEVAALAGSRRGLRAKIFGGASVLGGRNGTHLGAQNVEVARRCLDEAAIPIIASSILGERGRKLLFHTDDGSALVKTL